MPQDYYSVLGVEPAAEPAELKRAFHRLAKQYHPDRNPGNAAAEEKFKLLTEAWAVLGDERKRADYDAVRERDSRYAAAPELASMRHRSRVSRHSRERRQEERHAHRRRGTAPPPRTRLFLINRRRPMGLWGMVAIYVSCVLMILPPLVRGMQTVMQPPAASRQAAHTEIEDKHHPAEVVQQRLLQQAEQVRAAAEQGEAAAQMRYGLMLYNGLGIPMDRLAARDWWRRAAAQGNTAAASYLSHWTETPPPPPEGEEEPVVPIENAVE